VEAGGGWEWVQALILIASVGLLIYLSARQTSEAMRIRAWTHSQPPPASTSVHPHTPLASALLGYPGGVAYPRHDDDVAGLGLLGYYPPEPLWCQNELSTMNRYVG